MRIDRDNRHCYLTPRIGISTAEFGFDVIYEAPAPVKPDPYLVWQDVPVEPRPQRRAEPAPGGSAMSRPIQNFRGRHALVISSRRPEPAGARDARSPSWASA